MLEKMKQDKELERLSLKLKELASLESDCCEDCTSKLMNDMKNAHNAISEYCKKHYGLDCNTCDATDEEETKCPMNLIIMHFVNSDDTGRPNFMDINLN